MARMWIVVGDMTSSGGRVLSGSVESSIDGIPVARVGDYATCPRHPTGPVSIVDGDASILIDGRPVALHGSYLSCGCRVLSVQQTRAFVDQGAGAKSDTAGATVAPVSVVADLAQKPPVCLECLLAGASTGAPLLGRE